jgi:hypothetical protein
VYYWEGWSGYPDGNIIKFMEGNIPKADVFIAVFTTASNASKNCQKERDMALFQNKRIIPLFEEFSEVPPACQPYLGVNVAGKLPDQVLEALYKLITAPQVQKALAPEIRPPPRIPAETKVPFRGKLVLTTEIQILKKLEQELGQPIPTLEVNGEGAVVFLDFNPITLNAVPKALAALPSLTTVNFSPDSFATDADVKQLLFDGKEVSLGGQPYKPGQIETRIRKEVPRQVLKELEQSIGKSIPSVTNINWNNIGVKYDGDTIVELGLYNCGLMVLPESFSTLESLKSLMITRNQLIALPESFGQLKSLQTLWIDHNQLITLPESFSQLSRLRRLKIFSNPLDVKGYEILNQLKKNVRSVEIFTEKS